MAEEAIAGSNIENLKTRTFENGWIVCRSQKRPGLLYDFNTVTGEAVWRDSNKTPHITAIMDINKVPFDCHEPTEPPLDPNPHNQQKLTQSTPNIYNKQIINNQFPAKPFAIAPFGNACAAYGLLDPNSMNTMNTIPVWVTAPTTPQVLLGPTGPTVTSLNQIQTIYGGLENIQVQNSSVSLSNRFQVLNQLNTGSPIAANLQKKDDCNQQSYSHKQPRQNYKQWHDMSHQKHMKNHVKRLPDLRDKLSSRRRQDLGAVVANRCDGKVADKPDSVIVTEDDLSPDDNDEWLEAHTDGEGKELNMDIESFWQLADSSASRDCCYIIPTTRVLLNNIRFLASLVISDDRLCLLTPRDVVRTLRSVTFASDDRLSDYASRARTFAIRQLRKFPDNLKDAPNMKSCLELIPPNVHVVRLVDDKDILNQETINDGTITVDELKRFLTRTSNPKPKTVPKMQSICENIKITVTNDEIPKSLPQVAQPKSETRDSPSKQNRSTTTSAQEAPSLLVRNTAATALESPRLDTEKTGLKEIEIQTDITTPPGKQTANACVQTDFDFGVALSSGIRPNTNATTETAKEIKISSNKANIDAAGTYDNVATSAAPRKIRLKRQQQPNTNNNGNTEEIKRFKWRMRKSTLQAAEVEPCYQNGNISASSSTSLVIQPNDNSTDCKQSDVSAAAKIVDGSSTSGVSSDTFFTITKQAILNESKTDRSIVVFDVTSDFMADRLILHRDEWMSRFVQIMEEVLSQVLLLDPPFRDATLPPPWTFYEATLCVKRKFKNERTIVDASDKLAVFLLKINDHRGNIETHISPTDFMQIYTYGANLVNKLQLLFQDCEDLLIASQNLSKLLTDIREPGLEDDMETLIEDEPNNHSPNISEVVTDMSTIVSGIPGNSTPVNNESPKNKEKRRSCNNSPARYSLRSSRSQSEQKKSEETHTNAACSENKEYTLFSSLGLQKREFKVDTYIAKTISNSPKNARPSPDERSNNSDGASDNNIQDGIASNKEAKVEPQIIRSFSLCPEFEKRLKDTIYNNNEVDQTEVENDDSTNNYAPKDYATNNDVPDDYVEANYGPDRCITGGVEAENIDFTNQDFTNYEPYDYENSFDHILRIKKMDDDPYYENGQWSNLSPDRKLKKIIRIITRRQRRWLDNLDQFCKVTNATIKSPDYHEQEYQTYVKEKITKVGEHANNVCRRLKSILNRDPSVTRKTIRDLLNSHGIIDMDMNETQMAEYRVTIENHLELAERLLTIVTRLADAAVKLK